MNRSSILQKQGWFIMKIISVRICSFLSGLSLMQTWTEFGTKTAEDIINVTNVSMEVQWQELYYKYRGQVSQLTHMRRSEPDDLCGSEIKGDRKRGMFTMYEIGEICFGGYLCVVSMWDIRKREIPVWLIAAGGILSASLGYFHGKIPLVLMVTGALVGGVFLLISRLTQEAFGYGDSLMIAVTGVYLGFWNVLYLLVWAYVLAAVFAGYVLIRKGFQKDAAFPFVPFLLAAYIGIVCLGGI